MNNLTYTVIYFVKMETEFNKNGNDLMERNEKRFTIRNQYNTRLITPLKYQHVTNLNTELKENNIHINQNSKELQGP